MMIEEKNIDIKEATKDITELVVIDSDHITKRKIISFIETYKLTSKIVSLSMTDVIRTFEMKYDLDINFDKEGKVVITKKRGGYDGRTST